MYDPKVRPKGCLAKLDHPSILLPSFEMSLPTRAHSLISKVFPFNFDDQPALATDLLDDAFQTTAIKRSNDFVGFVRVGFHHFFFFDCLAT